VSTPTACITYRELGTASWYGKEFHGRKTASGDTFDMNGLSAAHRTLPLGATIRVTNLDNYKSIRVKVNDRGPFVRNRSLDLSYGAAKELGFVETGAARVKIEALDALAEGEAVYTVHVGAFLEEESALALRERLGRKFETVFIEPFETNIAKFYRVRVGAYASEEKAERVAAKLTLEGVEPVVVRRD
jgi:rare lipoprotein A